MILGNYQDQIQALPTISKSRYENIFKIYTTQNNQYYYNLLQSIYIAVDRIDPRALYQYTVKQNLPWSIISFNVYGTIDLWWLIALVNQINNPIRSLDAGTVLNIIRPEYLNKVLDEINNAISQ